MAKLTRGGVCYNLEESPFTFSCNYEDGMKLQYIFSSEFNTLKFINTLEEQREKIKESFTKRFGFNISNDVLADIKLYSIIEKRGFLIIKDNEEYFRCLSTIKLDGTIMTTKS